MAPQGIIYMSKFKNTLEMKYVRLTIEFNYFVLPASVGVATSLPSLILVTAKVGCLKA